MLNYKEIKKRALEIINKTTKEELEAWLVFVRTNIDLLRGGMGQIAEDIIEGGQCEWCGVCFPYHGHPVLCEDCWNNATKEEREGHTKATNEEYYKI